MSQQGTKASLFGGHTHSHQPTAHHHQAALAILTVFSPRTGRPADVSAFPPLKWAGVNPWALTLLFAAAGRSWAKFSVLVDRVDEL